MDFLNVNRVFESIRSDPRFGELQRRTGLTPQRVVQPDHQQTFIPYCSRKRDPFIAAFPFSAFSGRSDIAPIIHPVTLTRAAATHLRSGS